MLSQNILHKCLGCEQKSNICQELGRFEVNEKSINTSSKMVEILELSDKYFKVTMIKIVLMEN